MPRASQGEVSRAVRQTHAVIHRTIPVLRFQPTTTVVGARGCLTLLAHSSRSNQSVYPRAVVVGASLGAVPAVATADASQLRCPAHVPPAEGGPKSRTERSHPCLFVCIVCVSVVSVLLVFGSLSTLRQEERTRGEEVCASFLALLE